MIKLSYLKTALAAAAVAVVAWAPQPAHAETTLKVSTCLARNHDFIQAYFQTFFKPINDMNTDLKLRYLGGPEVTPRQKQAPAMKRGLIDIIVCPAAYYGGLLSEARLPGAQNKSLQEIRSNGGYEMMQTAWGKGLNSRILAWGYFGGQKFYIYTLKKPKISPQTGIDLTGIKMRSTGLYNALLKAMGATPITVSPSDVYASLERGVVGGLAWPWGSVAKYGWQRFLKYRVEPAFFGATLMTTINLDTWNKLSPAHKKILNDQSRLYESNGDPIIVKKGHEDDAKLKEAGVEVIKLTGAARDAYLKTIYAAKWAENDSKKNYHVDYKMLKAKLYSQ